MPVTQLVSTSCYHSMLADKWIKYFHLHPQQWQFCHSVTYNEETLLVLLLH